VCRVLCGLRKEIGQRVVVEAIRPRANEDIDSDEARPLARILMKVHEISVAGVNGNNSPVWVMDEAASAHMGRTYDSVSVAIMAAWYENADQHSAGDPNSDTCGQCNHC
jgi:hypothetical protein